MRACWERSSASKVPLSRGQPLPCVLDFLVSASPPPPGKLGWIAPPSLHPNNKAHFAPFLRNKQKIIENSLQNQNPSPILLGFMVRQAGNGLWPKRQGTQEPREKNPVMSSPLWMASWLQFAETQNRHHQEVRVKLGPTA